VFYDKSELAHQTLKLYGGSGEFRRSSTKLLPMVNRVTAWLD